jgi:lysophospholipase L1-like esterase
MRNTARAWIVGLFASAAIVVAAPATSVAQSQQIIAEDATRYLALGDSIAAGYKALPVTKGYAYLLYEREVFDEVSHTLFANAAVPGASSSDLLDHQVPQAVIAAADGGFIPAYVTVTIGGNDLLSILHFMQTHPNQQEVLRFANEVISGYGSNLWTAIYRLRTALPKARVFVANQYTIPKIEALVPLTAPLIAKFNGVVQQVVGQFGDHVYLVDVYSAFLGRHHLLLDELPGVSPFETHLTNAGHRVMARTFAEVIAQNR